MRSFSRVFPELGAVLGLGAMGKKGATRITAQDIKKMGDVGILIKESVKSSTTGDAEAKERAAAVLASLAQQNHNEHTDALVAHGALSPLVQILTIGSAKAQGSAATALHAILRERPAHQQLFVEAGGVPPLVRLLKTGSAKVQEEAASTLASIDADISHQKGILRAGSIAPRKRHARLAAPARQRACDARGVLDVMRGRTPVGRVYYSGRTAEHETSVGGNTAPMCVRAAPCACAQSWRC